jgi:putative ATPase
LCAILVPIHLRNAPTNLLKALGHGRDYLYPPDHGYTVAQDYLPAELKEREFFRDGE